METCKKKNILITAGPTWVPIDSIRIITSVFGGRLGWEIAREANRKGHRVTLLMGPGRILGLNRKTIPYKIIRFKYFDELLSLIKKELQLRSYDVMIHSAAVPDYIPKKVISGKIKSGNSNLEIRFERTIKIVNLIKKIDPKIFLVKFKLEVNTKISELIKVAYKSMIESNADLIIANDFNDMKNLHKAFIIKKDKSYFIVEGKKQIAKKIVNLISK